MTCGPLEGDPVRPLGFVVLYASYAEGEIDELLTVLLGSSASEDSVRQWPVGRKLRHAQLLVRRMRASELAGLQATLKEAESLFSRRNELVHGRLFGGGRLVSNRLSNASRQVSLQEIVGLAEELFNCKERLWIARCRNVVPLLHARCSQNDA